MSVLEEGKRKNLKGEFPISLEGRSPAIWLTDDRRRSDIDILMIL